LIQRLLDEKARLLKMLALTAREFVNRQAGQPVS